MQAEGVQCASARPFPGKGGHPLQWQGLGMWGRRWPRGTRGVWAGLAVPLAWEESGVGR